MKLSWNSIKISIAGAKLSHLVQKDSAWDHGSMVEQVKNIFYQFEKAKYKRNSETITKYVSAKGLQQIDQIIQKLDDSRLHGNTVLTEVSIINVKVRTNKHPDSFTALVKGKRKTKENEITQASANKESVSVLENFSEQWHFIRQGDWWLLDRISRKKIFSV